MKYIVFDLDDTLLRNDKTISPYTIKVLNKCRSLGHLLVINTARIYGTTKEFIEQLKPDFSIVCAGAQILDKDLNTIFCYPIDNSIVNKIISQVKDISERFTIQTETEFYTNKPDNKNHLLYDSNTCINLIVQKILVSYSNKEICEKLAKEYNLDYVTYLSGKWSRFNNINATKWKGIVNVVNYTSGSLDDVIAFGDDYGDLEMLEKANIGICMSNSVDKVLETIKTKTLSNNEDGVAYFLNNYFNLGEEY